MESNHKPNRMAWLGGFVATVVIAALIALWGGPAETAARLGDPPPDLPPFTGESISVEFAPDGLSTRNESTPVLGQQGWKVVFSDDFEAGITSDWINVDRDGSQNGDYKWGTRPIENTIAGGDLSAWGVGGGQDGDQLDQVVDGYPRNVESWLIYGPVDMSLASDAEISFNWWFDAYADDTLALLASSDGIQWNGEQTEDGGDGTWTESSFSLASYAGEDNVYIAFRFMSDNKGQNNKTGPFIDDVVIRVDSGNVQFLPHIQVQPSPTPTSTPEPPTPTPTPTATPQGGNYFNSFTNNIDGWDARRWDQSATGQYGFRHRADSDGGLQGALELELLSEDSYFIVSPLVQGKTAPYNIEYKAKLKNPQDRQMHGLVFGATWNGQPCPAGDFSSCFTTYYELRVQYRKFDGKEFQEMKLKKIDSHTSDGEPEGPTLIDWVKGANVGNDEWVEIDVNVSGDGWIRLTFNGKFRAEVRESEWVNNPYFGLMLITRENDDARVKYDYIKID